MPPQISDDEGSASDVSAAESVASMKQEVAKPEVTKAPAQKGRPKAAAAVKSEEAKAEADSDEAEDDEDDDDDDIGEDEYVVEKITSHMVDDISGELKYEVKWEGYEKKSDRTWEPEANLDTAAKILEDYLASVGGKDKIMADYHEKKSENSKGKKRGRASTDADANGTVAKRGRKGKNGVHPGSSTPPSSAAEFKPPSGNWEEQIVAIDACEGSEGAVVVYLTWKGGQKTQHPLSQVYKRCPQRMLKFYESHLVFKKNDEA